ncbi:MAG: hypothetical protein ACFFCI_01340 [Promethearchaeota archaeon]
MDNYDSLYEAWLDLSPEEQKEVAYLQGTKNQLFRQLNNSICRCPLCTNEDRDMVFIPEHEMWYCTDCQDKGLIWYPSHGSEEDKRQNDYVSWYLEQKDKFTKKYLDKDKAKVNK